MVVVCADNCMASAGKTNSSAADTLCNRFKTLQRRGRIEQAGMNDWTMAKIPLFYTCLPRSTSVGAPCNRPPLALISGNFPRQIADQSNNSTGKAPFQDKDLHGSFGTPENAG
jgi:hypothetical protein